MNQCDQIMAAPSSSPILSLPDEKLPHVLSYLALKEVLRMRLACSRYGKATFDSTHHLWMELEEEPEEIISPGLPNVMLSARRIRLLLSSFPKLRSLRLVGLRLVYDSLVRGRNGAGVSPRYLCSLLSDAECANNLECLELRHADEIMSNENQASDEWGAASPPSYGLHRDTIRLEKLTELTVEGCILHRDNPLVHSLLRASNRITHLSLRGCSRLNDHDAEEAIAKPLRNTLVRLDLSGSDVRAPTIRSSILKTLILNHCRNLRTLSSDSDCPSLDELCMGSCPFDGEGMLDGELGLVNSFPRLRKVDLNGCKKLISVRIAFPVAAKASVSVEDAAQNDSAASTERPDITVSTGLKELDLSMCVHLANVTIACPLKRIDLSGCFHLEELSIRSSFLETLDLSRLPIIAIRLDCPMLVRLNLGWCRNFDTEECKIQCQSLEHVDIRGASASISSEFFSDSSRKCRLTVQRDDCDFLDASG